MPASRAVEETRMPLAPPPHSHGRRVKLRDFGERLAEPDHDAGHAAVADDHVGAEPERHDRHRPGRARAGNACRSSTSAGSNSHSALPPLLNQTSGASGASLRVCRAPRTSFVRRSQGRCATPSTSLRTTGLRPHSFVLPRRANAVGQARRPFGDVAGAQADDHVARRRRDRAEPGQARRGSQRRGPCGGRGRASPPASASESTPSIGSSPAA